MPDFVGYALGSGACLTRFSIWRRAINNVLLHRTEVGIPGAFIRSGDREKSGHGDVEINSVFPPSLKRGDAYGPKAELKLRRAFKCHRQSSGGVREAQRARVQQQPRRGGVRRFSRVERIAQDGMAQCFQMHAQLV